MSWKLPSNQRVFRNRAMSHIKPAESCKNLHNIGLGILRQLFMIPSFPDCAKSMFVIKTYNLI